jgi:hypothetical protein
MGEILSIPTTLTESVTLIFSKIVYIVIFGGSFCAKLFMMNGTAKITAIIKKDIVFNCKNK